MLKYVFFDLDGTLLPMDQNTFATAYMGLLAKKMAPLGYEAKELINAVWKCTESMVVNDGSRSNEKAFWETFSSMLGERVYRDYPIFEEFYKNEFQQVQASCGFNEQANISVRKIREHYGVVLATNPLFPSIATESRIRWAGLNPEDFEIYTTYENIGYCKPNLDYYKELCTRLHIEPQEVLMVGNDVSEDMIAENLGMQVFLIKDNLINPKNVDISVYPNGSFPELLEYLHIA